MRQYGFLFAMLWCFGLSVQAEKVTVKLRCTSTIATSTTQPSPLSIASEETENESVVDYPM